MSVHSSQFTVHSTLDWLRFPLAIGVVFIHNYGLRVANCDHLVADPWCWESLYDMVRIFCSKVLPACAVPTFFLISGYLFFRNMPSWDWHRYGEKLRRRISSLLIPYLGWNIFHCLHLSWPALMRVFRGEIGWGPLLGMWHRWGDWRILWDGHHFGPAYENILGVAMPFTSPVLGPLWYVRDLMVIVLLAPLLYWLLRRGGRWLLALLGMCYVFNVWLPVSGFSATCTFWFGLGAWHAIEGRELVASLRRLRWVAYPMALAGMLLLLCIRCSTPGPDSLGLRLLNAVFVVAESISVVSLAGYVCQRGWLRWPAWLASSTFFIYLSHIFVRKQVMRPFLPVIRSGSYPVRLLVYLLVPLLTVLLCSAIHYLYTHPRLRQQKLHS